MKATPTTAMRAAVEAEGAVSQWLSATLATGHRATAQAPRVAPAAASAGLRWPRYADASATASAHARVATNAAGQGTAYWGGGTEGWAVGGTSPDG